MRKVGKSILNAIFIAPIGCTTQSAGPPVPDNVSLIQLLTFPQRYTGTVVSVAGFLTELGDELYLTEEHRSLVDGASAIHVSIAYKDDEISDTTVFATGCENQYARVDGRFVKHYDGSYGIIDVFEIAEPRQFPGPGPGRLSCWRNAEADPFLKERDDWLRRHRTNH
jgi:hypothetical protein